MIDLLYIDKMECICYVDRFRFDEGYALLGFLLLMHDEGQAFFDRGVEVFRWIGIRVCLLFGIVLDSLSKVLVGYVRFGIIDLGRMC